MNIFLHKILRSFIFFCFLPAYSKPWSWTHYKSWTSYFIFPKDEYFVCSISLNGIIGFFFYYYIIYLCFIVDLISQASKSAFPFFRCSNWRFFKDHNEWPLLNMCKKSWELYLITGEKTLSNIKESSIFKQTIGKKETGSKRRIVWRRRRKNRD